MWHYALRAINLDFCITYETVPMKAFILDDRKFPYVWISFILFLFVFINVLELNNTLQSKIVLVGVGVLSLYVIYVKYQYRKAQKLPILSWQLILPLAVVALIFLYTLWPR